MEDKTVLITGACGSLGSHVVNFLSRKNWKILATDINKEMLNELELNKAVCTVYMDVTENSSIEIAYKAVAKLTRGLDGVVNIAGVFYPGSLIEIDEETLYQVMNVNVLGTFRVNKAFFPLIKNNMGRIINISSETGLQSGHPFNGAYAMSKHAVEAYSDSLRRELMTIGIPVIKIQPGPIASRMVDNLRVEFALLENNSVHFKKILKRAKSLVAEEAKHVSDPKYVSQAIYEALTAPNPKHAYAVKPDLRRTMLEWLPISFQDRILKKVMEG